MEEKTNETQESVAKVSNEESTTNERDEELDVATAIDKAQDILRNIVGNLSSHQFKLESVKKNGTETRYIVISSVVPDMGQERDYYFIKIDVESGKIILPIGSGKMVDNKVTFKEIVVDASWEE